jgi:hypothetical protein
MGLSGYDRGNEYTSSVYTLLDLTALAGRKPGRNPRAAPRPERCINLHRHTEPCRRTRDRQPNPAPPRRSASPRSPGRRSSPAPSPMSLPETPQPEVFGDYARWPPSDAISSGCSSRNRSSASLPQPAGSSAPAWPGPTGHSVRASSHSRTRSFSRITSTGAKDMLLCPA